MNRVITKKNILCISLMWYLFIVKTGMAGDLNYIDGTSCRFVLRIFLFILNYLYSNVHVPVDNIFYFIYAMH